MKPFQLSNEYDNDGYSTESTITVEPLDNNLVVFHLDEFRNNYPIGLTSITLNQQQVKELISCLKQMMK